MIYLFGCTLDRACLYLIAKLQNLSCLVNLAHGTTIVSFRDDSDLINFFTTVLPLEMALQFEEEFLNKDAIASELDSVVEAEDKENNSFIYANNNGSHVGLPKTESSATTETASGLEEEVMDSPQSVIPSMCVELHFGDLPDDAVDFEDLFTNDDEQGTFHLEVNEPNKHLSCVMALALRVPRLKMFKTLDGNVAGIRGETIEHLANRPAESVPLGICVEGVEWLGNDHHRYVPHFDVTQDLLDMFNEKKLRNMTVRLTCAEDSGLLDKVLNELVKILVYSAPSY